MVCLTLGLGVPVLRSPRCPTVTKGIRSLASSVDFLTKRFLQVQAHSCKTSLETTDVSVCGVHTSSLFRRILTGASDNKGLMFDTTEGVLEPQMWGVGWTQAFRPWVEGRGHTPR